MENGSTTIILSAENHGEYPNMPPRRLPDRIFSVSRLGSAFSETGSVWYDHYRRSVSNAINSFEASIEGEAATVRREIRQSYPQA